MTTPNQAAPDGAVTIGGNTWKYGQLITEKQAREEFELDPPSNIVEAVQLLPELLARLPNESMKPWQKWLNLTDEDRFNGTVRQRLIESLADNPLKKTIDGIVRGLVGWVETGYTPEQVEAAAKDVAETLSDMRAIITALLASNGYAGTARVIDFNTAADSPSLGAEWSQIYFSGSGAGTLGVSGSRARWIGAADQRWCSARYVDAQTKSDYQKIGVAFSAKPSRNIFGGAQSVNRIMARVSDDQQSFVAVDFTADGFTLGCQISGAWTTWYTRVSTLGNKWEFKAGASYWLEAGTSGGARIYRVWENNKILTTFVESGAASHMGSGYRSVGMGCMAFSDTQLPAPVAAFAFYDNQSAEKRGSGWRISRTNTDAVNVENGENLFPNNWFDTPDYITDDLIYASTYNKITISATGWYHVTITQHGDNSIVGGASVQPLLLVDGGVVMRGRNTRWGGFNDGFGDSFIVYLEEGSEVQPGYYSSSNLINNLGGGEAAGLNTYWSGVYLGTNKKLPTETTT